MSDWDASEDETAPAPSTVKPAAGAPKGRFADEDASDSDAKDDWDASDSEDEDKKVAAKPAGPAPPVRAKGITKQKIAEKEAAEKARLAELEARRNENASDRRAREKEAQLKADLDNAAALFGGVSVSGGGDDLLNQRCVTKADFETLSKDLSQKIIDQYSDSPLFASFIVSFVRQVAGPLKDIDVRSAASGLTTLANEKQQAAKAAQGKGKKGKAAAKPALGSGKTVGRADTRMYEEVLDDGEFDDFM